MKNIHVFMIFFALLFSVSSNANLRAPYIMTFGAGQSIKSVKGLKVTSEKLHFDFLNYATGNIFDVSQNTYMCRITAIYSIISEKNTSAEMEFVSPSDTDTSVKINGNTAPVKSEPFPVNNSKQQRRQKTSLYALKFDAFIINGANDIEVSYLQPVSIHETSHGYFRKSKYASFVSYEFWPVKEWEMSVNFSAEILVSIPYKRKIIDLIGKQRLEFKLKCLQRDNTEYNEESKMKIKDFPSSFKNSTLSRKYMIYNDFPDIINIIVEEK